MATVPLRPEAPPEFDALDAAAAGALAVVEGADEWDARTRQAALVRVQRHLDAMAALNLKLIAAEQRAGTWALRGDRDLAGFAGRVSRQGRGAGLSAVGQAVALAAMPAVADALVDGPVTATHVAQIARATQASAALAAQLATPQGQARVVEMAGRLDGGDFGKALRQMSAALDPVARQREHDEQRAGRSLAITRTPGGTLVRVRLDNVAGHAFAKAIDAHDPRPAEGDERSREQRRADALMAMVHRVLSDKGTSAGSTAPVQALVTMSERTWAALRGTRPGVAGVRGGRPDVNRASCADGDGGDVGEAGSGSVPGSARDVMDRLRGVDPVVDEVGQAWPASEVARALCDCALTRAVVGAPGLELNLGRTERLFRRRHWLALYASGVRTCAVEGCGMPLAFTELHHMRWWLEQGGRTDLLNCAPECSFHHHEIHRLGIVVTRRPDGSYEHRYPDGRVYGGAPPGTVPVTDRDASPVDLLDLLPA